MENQSERQWRDCSLGILCIQRSYRYMFVIPQMSSMCGKNYVTVYVSCVTYWEFDDCKLLKASFLTLYSKKNPSFCVSIYQPIYTVYIDQALITMH